MQTKRLPIPEDLDDRLWSWARYYRDRHALGKCGSAEGKFRPHSDDYAKEGWGDPMPVKPQAPARHQAILEAIQTNEAIMKLSLVQKWAITYYYCFVGLPRFVVLKSMRKFTGRRLNWQQFVEQVDLGRLRLNFILSAHLIKTA